VSAQYQIEVNTVEGRAETEPKMLAESRAVTPGYFATLRIPLLAGATCRDDFETSGVMVNRSFANAYLAGSAAIGHHLMQAGNWSGEIRGIVGDARESGMDREPSPTVYWCYSALQPGTYFLVRTHGDPASMAETIRRKIHEIEPRRSVYDLTPLADRISDAYAENRLRTILLAFFAITAVSLACVGLYGTLSYLVNVRQREVGLRLALGALRTQIVRQFLTQGLTVSVLGCAAGLALTAVFGRLLSGMLFGVSAWDVVTLSGVVAIVLTVSVLASLLPAIRAARLEPMQVLREQ
jgi:putative ABC transport system permease protein